MRAERKLVVSSSFSRHRASLSAFVRFSRRQQKRRLSTTQGGKTEPQGRRPPWASKGNTLRLRLREPPSYLPIFVCVKTTGKKRSALFVVVVVVGKRRRRPSSFSSSCRCCASLDTKSKANTNTNDDDNEREREKERERTNAFWRRFVPFFFVPFFCVSLLEEIFRVSY